MENFGIYWLSIEYCVFIFRIVVFIFVFLRVGSTGVVEYVVLIVGWFSLGKEYFNNILGDRKVFVFIMWLNKVLFFRKNFMVFGSLVFFNFVILIIFERLLVMIFFFYLVFKIFNYSRRNMKVCFFNYFVLGDFIFFN